MQLLNPLGCPLCGCAWQGACRVHYVAGGRVVRHLGDAYERASALASRMNVPQEQLLERYEENSRKALEHEKAAKALALEVVALLGEVLQARVVSVQPPPRLLP